MRRSLDVSLLAVLSGAGSTLLLLFGGWVAMRAMHAHLPPVKTAAPAPGLPPPPAWVQSPETLRGFMIGMAVLGLVLPAAWGLLTALGLWLLKNWARISLAVFASLVLGMAGCTACGAALMRFAPNLGGGEPPPPGTFPVVGGFALLQAAAGAGLLFWLFRPRIKRQFTTAPPAAD